MYKIRFLLTSVKSHILFHLSVPVTTSLGLIKLDCMCQLINLIDWNSHDVVVV